ncbi:uncharacterized protein TRUGW13939_02974 [Talaromyces rugulosus]|uniref:Uncharacterized protein n=1 Tax=Talaromyces rugulosus TaxID=121627 RepID=A0A7H8QQZ1_TALRU|nr:uncharacterized protein TRUGW13939_02974 [Talaromyces rugulosus]QKX55875.1 hypothetical protein TRUGW13939_02974 [Talaromyces rugulosus]
MSTPEQSLSSPVEESSKSGAGEHGSQQGSIKASTANNMAQQEADSGEELIHIDPSPLEEQVADHDQQLNQGLQHLSISSQKPQHLSLQTNLDVPPPPPQKDETYIDPTPKTPQASHSPIRLQTQSEYTEKELPDVPQVDTTPQPQKDVEKEEAAAARKSEDDQSEIQSIMEQFSHETNGLRETEIMSPRLEFAEQFKGKGTQFPPRRSSLDAESIPSSIGRPSLPSPIVVPKPSPHSASETPGTPRSVSSLTGMPPPEPEPDQPFDFHRFLEQLRHRTADPVAKFLRSFLMEFGKKQWLVHEQVKIISDFLAFITNKMAQCEVWRHVSDLEFDNAKEGMEKLVMNRLYGQTFSPAIPAPPSVPRSVSRSKRRELERLHGPGRRGQHQEDVERDEILAQKIRIYSWIRPEHLDIPALGSNGRRFINLAQQELAKIKGYRAPRDKVICILNCCKVIFGLLKHSKNPDTSADSFIPLLIFVVLKANPEHLVSNVQYILRFRNQDKLGGEAGYYLSSLSGALQFIETLDRTSLTVTDEEFEKNVEAAVSAIAQENLKAESESSTSAHVTPRASTDAERQHAQRKEGPPPQSSSSSAGEGENAPVAGLLRTIQKPLSTIGRMFADEPEQGSSGQPQPTTLAGPAVPVAPGPRPAGFDAQEAAARQASAEAAEARKIQRAEHQDVVETLSAMFPNLDRDVIDDVVRVKEGRVGLAVDACLALSSTDLMFTNSGIADVLYICLSSPHGLLVPNNQLIYPSNTPSTPFYALLNRISALPIMATPPLSENKQKMARGELYYAFTPELLGERTRCKAAVRAFNAVAGVASRRESVRLWREIVGDSTPLPPELPDAAADEAQFDDDPVVEGGLYMDYGTQVKLGKGVYINAHSTWIDTCTITVGARTLFGPNVSLYSGTHPLDPELRNGTNGPETGKEIHIGEDCWLGGNVTVLAGVTIGRGSTVGAGSVVTKVCSRRMCNLDNAAYMQTCTGFDPFHKNQYRYQTPPPCPSASSTRLASTQTLTATPILPPTRPTKTKQAQPPNKTDTQEVEQRQRALRPVALNVRMQSIRAARRARDG